MNARPSTVSITCPDQRNSTGPGGGEVLAHPGFEPREARLGILRLAGLVVLAADDQDVHGLVVVSAQLAVGRPLEPDVVVRILGVPVERVGDRAGGDAGADRIGMIRRLFGMNRDEIVERRVGRDDDRWRVMVWPDAVFT